MTAVEEEATISDAKVVHLPERSAKATALVRVPEPD